MIKSHIKKLLRNVLDLIFNKEKNNNEKINPKFFGTIAAGNKNLIFIGDSVSFGGNVLLFANAPIEIGDHTMIAYNTIVHTSTHDYSQHPMWIKRIDQPVKIGKHVWIGAAAIILPGVIIEDFAVIGAGSVVNANVPEGAIVAGNPARVIKFRQVEEFKNMITPDYPVGSFQTNETFKTKYTKEL